MDIAKIKINFTHKNKQMMKTKLKNILFIILISGIIISCHCKNTYQYVPDENKLIYQQDELVIFKSNLGNCDTFRIDIEKHFEVGDEYACGFMYWGSANEYNNEFIRTNFIDVRTGKTIAYVETHIDNDNSYYVWLNDCSFFYSSDFLIGSYTINNIEFKDVYNVKKFESSCCFKEIYFNKTYGLIKYILKTGEEWAIQR